MTWLEPVYVWRHEASTILRVEKVDGNLVPFAGDDDAPMMDGPCVEVEVGFDRWAVPPSTRLRGSVTVDMDSPPHELLWGMAKVTGMFGFAFCRGIVVIRSLSNPTVELYREGIEYVTCPKCGSHFELSGTDFMIEVEVNCKNWGCSGYDVEFTCDAWECGQEFTAPVLTSTFSKHPGVPT